MKKFFTVRRAILLAAFAIVIAFVLDFHKKEEQKHSTVSAIEHALAKCPSEDTCTFRSEDAVYRIQEMERKRKPEPGKILAGEVFIRIGEQRKEGEVVIKATISPEGEIRSALLAGAGIKPQTLSGDDPKVLTALASFRRDALGIN